MKTFFETCVELALSNATGASGIGVSREVVMLCSVTGVYPVAEIVGELVILPQLSSALLL